MLRVLGVLLPACLGAALVWFFAPSFQGPQPVPVDPDLPAWAPIGGEDERPASKPANKKSWLQGRDLDEQAQQLYGEELRILTLDANYSMDDLRQRGEKFVSRALVECWVFTDAVLRMGYLASIEGSVDDPRLLKQPTTAQLRTCKNVFKVDAEMHGTTFDF